MNPGAENEIRKEFQLERLIFFSDAVFAIIITIMILDVKLPEALIHPTEDESKNAFLQILPKLCVYAISFFVIGSFWMRHLKIFSFLKDYNKQVIALNLLFLFSISLFPFALSFSFNSSYILQYSWGLYTYIGIIYLAFLTQTLLIHYLIRNRNELALHPHTIAGELRWKVRRLSYFNLPIIFGLFISVIYFHLSYYFIIGLFVSYGLLIRTLKKKWYPGIKQDDITLFSFFRKPKGLEHHAKSIKK